MTDTDNYQFSFLKQYDCQFVKIFFAMCGLYHYYQTTTFFESTIFRGKLRKLHQSGFSGS